MTKNATKARMLYRAVPAGEVLDPHKPTRRRSTPRLPTNVPYFVDNVWESLRPTQMPSRRHAIYASPTPELALANASADRTGAGYVVCRLSFEGSVKVAQLRERDARRHPDIRKIAHLVQAQGEKLAGCSSDEKRLFALLFMPGATPYELNACAQASSLAAALLAGAREASTFWHDARPGHGQGDGEPFFELDEKAGYTLVPIRTVGQTESGAGILRLDRQGAWQPVKGRMVAFILTLMVATNAGMTSITHEYASSNACEVAKARLREALVAGKVVLLTCTSRN